MRRDVLALALLLAGARAHADACPTRPLWPTRGWTTRVDEITAARAGQIHALEDFAFTLVGADEERRGARTDAVLIVHQGAIFYERYARGWTAEMPHYTWSVSKTFGQALAGIAVAQGALQLDDPICRYAPTPSAARCGITVQNALEFATGFAWTESYENQSNQASSVLAMLYGEGHRDIYSFVTGHDARDAPGQTYMYSSGDANVVSGVVDAALRPRFGEDYPHTLLFQPLGMDSAVMERDGRGVPVGSSYVYATPRDLAKFGFFYLNDGCWESQRILPERWVHDAASVSVPFTLRPLDTSAGDVQGRQLWLNRPVPEQHVSLPWEGVPDDAYAARGHWGQSITVIPSLDLVIVRVADDRDGMFDFPRFLRLATAVVQ